MLAAACTGESVATSLVGEESATPTSVASTVTFVAPPEVDIGVDVEAGIVMLAVVGDVSDDLWEGHFAYWNDVNSALGGLGGQFDIELVRVATADDANTVGALAVSISASDDASAKSVVDLTRRTIAASLDAAETAISTGAVLDGTRQLVSVVGDGSADCPDGAVRDTSRVALGGIAPSESPGVYVLCVGAADVLTAAAEVLTANPGSAIVIPGQLWRPELARLLEGSDVVIAGYVPEPGTEGAVAADVMGLTLGLPPWSADLVDGYTQALSLHAVLEAALAAGDLTQESIVQRSSMVLDVDLGFGPPQVPVGVLDTSSATGVRTLVWVSTTFPLH